MEKIKLLLYCTKSKPYLIKNYDGKYISLNNLIAWDSELNGYIVAECDFEVEERLNYGLARRSEAILKGTCLTMEQLDKYLPEHKEYDDKDVFYAIHIKNLNIFDKPRELSDYNKRIGNDFQVLGNAPENMMKCCEIKYMVEDYILISIRPEWLCKILNNEKTIEVRKKVLKEMM